MAKKEQGEYLSEEQVIELSKQNPTEIYENQNGKVVYGGEVFSSMKDLERTMKMMNKILSFTDKFKKMFSWFRKSK